MIGMECFRLRAALVDFAEGSLAEPKRGGVERHVADCAECASAVLALREVPAALRRTTEREPDEAFWARQRNGILRAIEAGPAPRASAPPPIATRRIGWRLTPALAAAAVLALFLRSWPPTLPTATVGPVASRTAPTEESHEATTDAAVDAGPYAAMDDATFAGLADSLDYDVDDAVEASLI